MQSVIPEVRIIIAVQAGGVVEDRTKVGRITRPRMMTETRLEILLTWTFYPKNESFHSEASTVLAPISALSLCDLLCLHFFTYIQLYILHQIFCM